MRVDVVEVDEASSESTKREEREKKKKKRKLSSGSQRVFRQEGTFTFMSAVQESPARYLESLCWDYIYTIPLLGVEWINGYLRQRSLLQVTAPRMEDEYTRRHIHPLDPAQRLPKYPFAANARK